jgi:hypothetical protein
MPRSFGWRVLSLLCLSASLCGCCFEGEPATLAESIGVFHRAVPGGTAKLAVKEDGSWEYRVEDVQGRVNFQRTGAWKYDGRDGGITFYNFEFDFLNFRYPDHKTIDWMPLIENLCGGIQICFFPTELDCLHKVQDSSMLTDMGGEQ